jgi:hypothetical protein
MMEARISFVFRELLFVSHSDLKVPCSNLAREK